jgi:hypothetical protein
MHELHGRLPGARFQGSGIAPLLCANELAEMVAGELRLQGHDAAELSRRDYVA